jgi:hypothetical protein
MVINKKLLVSVSALIIMSSFIIVSANEMMHNVKPKKLYATYTSYYTSTNSSTWIPIPYSNLTFKTGKKSGSLVITFSADTYVKDGWIFVAANVSTATSWSFASGPMYIRDTYWDSRTMVWIFKEVEPLTTYTVTIMWRTYPSGTWAYMYRRTLTVLWNKGIMR